jgi:hypothetical protein
VPRAASSPASRPSSGGQQSGSSRRLFAVQIQVILLPQDIDLPPPRLICLTLA